MSSPLGRLMLIYLFGITFQNYLKCQNLCDNIDTIDKYRLDHLKEIIKTEKEKQFQGYYYSMIIQFDQYDYDSTKNFKSFNDLPKIINPPFNITVYDASYNQLELGEKGQIILRHSQDRITLTPYEVDMIGKFEINISTSNIVQCRFFRNGSIFFHYITIPDPNNFRRIDSSIYHQFFCFDKRRNITTATEQRSHLKVPNVNIKNNTIVMFHPLPRFPEKEHIPKFCERFVKRIKHEQYWCSVIQGCKHTDSSYFENFINN
ncbi:unnamed protein product [Schistosoma turkestanicum]|nr:unnamed protein product [Schistosoma turkestanicum]